MKRIIYITLFSFVSTSFMIASTDKFTDKIAVIGSPGLSSDPCSVIDKKLIRLDEFTYMVNNTSAFHLEEKASALPVPGITISNNKKKMLRDAKKKYTQYAAERQKYGCDTSMSASIDKKDVVSNPAVLSDPSVTIDQKPVKHDKVTTKVNNTSTSPVVKKASARQVSGITVSNQKEKKKEVIAVEHPKYTTEETPKPVINDQIVEKKVVASKPVSSTNSSDSCAAIDKKFIELYEFMIMVNNTSAFHLEEKASALPVPGITISNNKKKMLRDAEKKRVELLEERQKYGCEPISDQ